MNEFLRFIRIILHTGSGHITRDSSPAAALILGKVGIRDKITIISNLSHFVHRIRLHRVRDGYLMPYNFLNGNINGSEHLPYY